MMDRRRKKAEQMARVGFSEDIAAEILLRLPVKSLLRFKTVCKSWDSIVSNTLFIRKHLNRAHSARYNQHKDFLGVLIPYWDARCPCVLFKEDSGGVILFKEFYFPVENLAGPEEDMIPRACNSCDGLICFHMELASALVIWNPSLPKDFRVIDTLSSIGKCALGYDPCSDDYMIVSVPDASYVRSPPPYISVQLLSLKRNSWRTLHITKTVDYCIENSEIIYAKSCLHWLAKGFIHSDHEMDDDDDDEEKCFIVYFDLADESLGYLNLPLSIDWPVAHVNYKESLAILGVNLEGERELWVLEDYCGMKSSWTKILKFSCPYFEPSSRYCFTLKGELLVSDENGLAIVDTNDGSLKDVIVEDVEYEGENASYFHDDEDRDIFISPYVESLVSPTRL